MKKLLIVPAFVLLSTGFAFAGSNGNGGNGGNGGGTVTLPMNVAQITQAATATNYSTNLQLAAILQGTRYNSVNSGVISQTATATGYSANVQAGLILQNVSHVSLPGIASPF